MKVVVISEKYHPYISGGAEKSLKILIDGIREGGIEPVIITLSPEAGHKVACVDGVKVHYIGLKNFYWPFDGKSRPNVLHYLFHLRDAINLPMVRDVIRLVDHEKPALVHTNNLCGLGVLTWRHVKARSIPILHTLRDYHLMCPFSTRYRNSAICQKTCTRCKPMALTYRRHSAFVDGVVGNSSFVLKCHIEAGYFPNASRKSVIYNASPFRRTGEPPRLRSEAPTFGFLGRIVPEKGIELLLDTMIGLDSMDWTLRIAGEGADGYCSMLKRRYDHPRITWEGWVGAQGFLETVDCVVVPSLWNEPLTRVIFEAFSCGVPVIASCRGGNAELIEDGLCGFLFDPGDPQSLTSALRKFAERDTDIAGLRLACLEASKKFAPERLSAEYVSLYSELTRCRRDAELI